MDCLRDQEIDILDKKQALQLVPFLAVDAEGLEIFEKCHIEDQLIDLLKNPSASDSILN